MAQTITIANSKGGVGKTTTSRELAYLLAQTHRVLLIDLDPQRSLTKSLAVDPQPPFSLADVLNKAKSLQSVLVTVTDTLSLGAGHPDLVVIERSLHKPAGEFSLKRAIEPIKSQFDFVIIDTVGQTSQLVLNAIVAADALIIPLRPQGTDLDALPEFLELIQEINTIPSVKLEKLALLPNEYNSQSKHHQEAVASLRELGYKVLPTIGRSAKVAEAIFEHKSISQWDRSNPRVNEYAQLTEEVKAWLK